MSENSTGPSRFYWERCTDGKGGWREGKPPDGADLAALRRGLGRQPGDVPAMWRFYRTLSRDGQIGPELYAEHAALALFATHQQSRAEPMHRTGIGLGDAMLAARRSGKYSPEAIDRRFAAAATSDSPGELVGHLRGLVTQLRAERQPLDYTRLMRDLIRWQGSGARDVRRRWGSQYFASPAGEDRPAPRQQPRSSREARSSS